MEEFPSILAKFQHEQIAFLRTSIYLSKMQTAALSSGGSLKENYQEFAQDLLPHYPNPHDYVIGHLLLSLISSFELYLQETVSFVVKLHPKKVGKAIFELNDILQYKDHNILIQRAVNDLLNKMMYKKPAEYLKEIIELLSISDESIKPLWPTFIEAKARRDIGIHNAWKINEIYLRKLQEANINTEMKIGEFALPDEKYLSQTPKLLSSLSIEFHAAVRKKHLIKN